MNKLGAFWLWYAMMIVTLYGAGSFAADSLSVPEWGLPLRAAVGALYIAGITLGFRDLTSGKE